MEDTIESNNNLENVEQNINNNLEIFQQNINENYFNLTEDLNICITANPLIFYHDNEKFKYFECGKKVIAPKYLLHELSKYQNLEFPIHIKINEKIFTILDFLESIDCIYIPTQIFYELNLNENEFIDIKILKNIPPKASFLKLKPHSEKFYEIKNIKQYLEIHLKKLFPIIEKNEILNIPYKHEIINLTIKDCKPENILSLNEIEELEIDFEPLIDVKNISNEKNIDMNQNIIPFKKPENKKENKETESNKPKKFVPFSGKGRRLCD